MSKGSAKPGLRQEAKEALGEELAQDVSRYVVPIFTDIEGAPVPVGTGLLLNTEFDQVLVTAAHVLEEGTRAGPFYLYVAPAVKRAIGGEVLVSKRPPSGSRDDDFVDTAVVILEGGPGDLPPFVAIGKESLPISRVIPRSIPRCRKRYGFLGVPASKARTSTAYAYFGSSVSNKTYTRFGLDQTFHVVLPLHKRNGVTLDGAKFNFSLLEAMSGSPLWELRKPVSGGRRVVGIMLRDRRWSNHVVIAVDIWFALRMLAEHYQATGRLP